MLEHTFGATKGLNRTNANKFLIDFIRKAKGPQTQCLRAFWTWRSRWDSNSEDFILFHKKQSKYAFLGSKMMCFDLNRSISYIQCRYICGQNCGQSEYFLYVTFNDNGFILIILGYIQIKPVHMRFCDLVYVFSPWSVVIKLIIDYCYKIILSQNLLNRLYAYSSHILLYTEYFAALSVKYSVEVDSCAISKYNSSEYFSDNTTKYSLQEKKWIDLYIWMNW